MFPDVPCAQARVTELLQHLYIDSEDMAAQQVRVIDLPCCCLAPILACRLAVFGLRSFTRFNPPAPLVRRCVARIAFVAFGMLPSQLAMTSLCRVNFKRSRGRRCRTW
jgi:hypothetical protein